MSSWIETELKLLLPNRAAWQRIRAALGPGRVVVQVNHFFDRADGALAAARIAVRLRSEGEGEGEGEGERNRLTVKGKQLESAGGALSRRIELETDMTRAELNAALGGGLDLLPWLARFEAQGIGGVPSSDVSGFLETLGSICRGVHLARNAGFTNRRERLRVELRDEEGAFEIELDGAPEHAAPARREPRQVERALRQWLNDLAAIEVTPAPSKLERLRALPRSSP